MTTPATPVPPPRSPSMVDILARQSIALADQIKAVRAALDALDRQNECVLETTLVLQTMDAQRRAAASVRAGAEDEAPVKPTTFGRRAPDVPMSTDAPSLPPIPADLNTTLHTRDSS